MEACIFIEILNHVSFKKKAREGIRTLDPKLTKLVQ